MVAFPLEDGTLAIPCGTRYCAACLQAGEPFTTRLKEGKGLCFPKRADPSHLPNYTCEACQVRAILGRELRYCPKDIHLLRLERMRLLDTIHHLSESSWKTYKYPLRRIQEFETYFGVDILSPTPIQTPPRSACIPLMWAQLNYTLRESRTPGERVKYSSSRMLRSAASAFYEWDLLMSRPEQVMKLGKGDQSWVTPYVRPTDELGYSLFSSGMQRRMGDVSKKSFALQYKHVKFLDSQFRELYAKATSHNERHEIATAGTANLTFWLGWLRGGEGFGLKWDDVKTVPPEAGPLHGLPNGIGFVEFRLLPETKTNSSSVADVVIAHTTWSGLSLGWWMEELQQFTPTDGESLFSTPKCPTWTSGYFRSQHVWRHLETLRAMGEPSLACFSDEVGQRICDRVYSMHSWRRGANTFCERFEPGLQLRRARPDELYEHARWSRRGSSEEMHVHYREWDLPPRIGITQFCM